MRYKFASFILLMLCFIAGRIQAQNLLSTPGFESFPPSLLLTSGTVNVINWRYFSVNGASFTLQATSDAHWGSLAAKLTRSSTAGDAGLDRDGTPRIPVIAGHQYLGSLWAKSSTGAKMMVTIAPYDSNGVFLGGQIDQTFQLTTSYTQYSLSYTVPTGTASLNFAIRVSGTGTIIVDDCSLIDTSVVPVIPAPPSAPSITHPVNEAVDTLKPVIAFAGSAHTAYQVVLTDGSGTVWDSGEVPFTSYTDITTSGYTATCPINLRHSSSYQVKVGMKNAGGWSDYCAPVSFNTPAGPIVRITSPVEADSVPRLKRNLDLAGRVRRRDHLSILKNRLSLTHFPRIDRTGLYDDEFERGGTHGHGYIDIL